VDADKGVSTDANRLKTDSPNLIEIFIADSGTGGHGDHRIARKSRVLRICARC